MACDRGSIVGRMLTSRIGLFPLFLLLDHPHRANRKAHGKRRTFAFARAVGFDRAAMRFYDVFDNGKPQSEPGEPPPRTAVGLPKAVKDPGQQFSTDALAIVAHLNLIAGPLATQRDVDSPSLGRELD